MIRKNPALAATFAVALGSVAFAQAPAGDNAPATPPPSAAPQSPAPETPSSASFSEAKLRAFAKATATLQQQPNLSPQEQVQKVEQSGLSAEEYNSIAATAQKDPTVMQQLQQYMQQQAPAQP